MIKTLFHTRKRSVRPESIPSSAGMQNLSDELIIAIAEHVHDSSACDYSHIIQFCLVNKQFARCGQDVMFRHIHLGSEVDERLPRLLETLTSRPDLFDRIWCYGATTHNYSNEYDDYSSYHPYQRDRWRYLRRSIWPRMFRAVRGWYLKSIASFTRPDTKSDTSSYTTSIYDPRSAEERAAEERAAKECEERKARLVEAMPNSPIYKERGYGALDLPEEIRYHLVLMILSSGLTHIDLDMSYATSNWFFPAFKQLCNEPTLPFESLSSVRLACHTQYHPFLDLHAQIRCLLLLPGLRRLELENFPSVSGYDKVEKLFSKDKKKPQHEIRLEELSLNGWCAPTVLGLILRHLKHLQSLVYRPTVHHNMDIDELAENSMWDQLLLLKDSIQRLRLEFFVADDTCCYIWPRHMDQFYRMTHFSLTGRFGLAAGGIPQSIRLVDFIPPNVEELVWAPFSAQSSPGMTAKNSSGNLRFASELCNERPNLRVLTVPGGIYGQDAGEITNLLKDVWVDVREWDGAEYEEVSRRFHLAIGY